jgi:hypothetical protein
MPDRLVGFALLDFLVDAFLDENAFQRAEMQFILKLAFFKQQFALKDSTNWAAFSAAPPIRSSQRVDCF